MVDGDIDSAEAITHTRIAVTQNDGTVLLQQVVETLDSPPQKSKSNLRRSDDYPGMDDHIEHMQDMSSPPPGQAKKKRVSICNSHTNKRG